MNRLAFSLVLVRVLVSTAIGQSSETASEQRFLPLAPGLIALDSPRGQKLFEESGAKESFWQLVQFYASQPDQGSCSVATCTMVLNALPIARPASPPHGEFRLFTPENLFSPSVEALASRQKVSQSGMTLDQLAKVLGTFPLDVDCEHATAERKLGFRTAVTAALRSPGHFVIVNYFRKAIGQQTAGHISPLGAYNAAEDRVLILDVANYKYPWVWVKVDDLWPAMEAVDNDSHLARGYIVVTAKK